MLAPNFQDKQLQSGRAAAAGEPPVVVTAGHFEGGPAAGPRLLQVAASVDRRGAEVFAQQLGEALRSAGVDVTDVAMVGGHGPKALPFRVLGRRPLAPFTIARLVAAARQADVIVVHGSWGLWPSVIASSISRHPFIYRNIGDPSYWARRPLTRRRTALALRRAAAVVALSEGLRNTLIAAYGLDPDKVTVAANAVDSGRFPLAQAKDRSAARQRFGLGQTDTVLGYLGALSPEKRPEWAVRVASELPDVVLAIAGEGPLADELERLAEAGAPGRVRLLGSINDPAAFLAAIDVLLLPSETEGMPGALIEAGLVGRCAVATDVGAVRELVGSAVGGLVVDVNDQAGFVNAVRTVLRGGALPAGSRSAAAETYDIKAIMPLWKDIIRKVAGSG